MDPIKQRPRETWLLGAILLAGLALRLGWALSRPVDPLSLAALPDQVEYLTLGRNLLQSGTLAFFDPRFGQTVWAYRMPGYPAFIAVCGGMLPAIRAVQAILDTSTIFAIYLLGRRVLPTRRPTAPLWAAAMVALNPYLIYFNGLILSETIFTAMIAWGMALLAAPNHEDRPRPFGSRQAGYGMVLLVLTVLVRPEAILLPCALAAAVLAVNNARYHTYDSRIRRALFQAAITLPLLLVVIELLPWGYRNLRVLGRPVPLTTNDGITLYDGNHLEADGSSNQTFLKEMPQLKTMTEVDRNSYFTTKAKDFIASHPAESLDLAVRKLGRTWTPMPLSAEFGSRVHVFTALAYSLPFDLLAILGLITARVKSSAKVFLLMPAIYLTAVHIISVGSLRYRIPAEPPMAILAAIVLSKALPASGDLEST